MIQRVQSLYLLTVSVLGILFCVFPFGEAGGETLGYASWWPFAVVSTLIPALAFASLFLFRKRVLQMRLNSLNAILIIMQALVAVLIVYLRPGAESAFRPLWPVTLPPIEVILTLLAIRAIAKDEVLVRAADRLR